MSKESRKIRPKSSSPIKIIALNAGPSKHRATIQKFPTEPKNDFQSVDEPKMQPPSKPITFLKNSKGIYGGVSSSKISLLNRR